MKHIGEVIKHPGFKDAIRILKIDDCPSPTLQLTDILNISGENTFHNFKHRYGTQSSFEAFEALGEGKADKPFLLCHGEYGNGKTHLLQAAILELYKRGIICPYNTFEDILRLIKSGMSPGAYHNADQLTQIISRWKALAIDDFGLGSETKWAEGRLDVIMDYRYRHRLLTILVTNKPLEELPGRVESRFSDPEVSQIVLNKGTDYRRRKI